MSTRDWEKELAKIDKQLASIPDEELVAAPTQPGIGMPRGVSAPALRAPAASAPTVGVSGVTGKAKAWAFTKLALAVAAGAAIWFWPWPARCGLPLVYLVAAGGGASLLGVWSSAGTWRLRMGRAHVLSLLVIVSGAVLIAREVLPRVGYAQSTFDRPDRWSCQAAAPAPGTAPLTEPGTPGSAGAQGA